MDRLDIGPKRVEEMSFFEREAFLREWLRGWREHLVEWKNHYGVVETPNGTHVFVDVAAGNE